MTQMTNLDHESHIEAKAAVHRRDSGRLHHLLRARMDLDPVYGAGARSSTGTYSPRSAEWPTGELIRAAHHALGQLRFKEMLSTHGAIRWSHRASLGSAEWMGNIARST